MNPLALRLRPELLTELRDVIAWYEAARPGLGTEFQEAFFGEIDGIATSAVQHRCLYREFRRVVMRRFPYLIYFKVEAQTAVIFLLAHSSRNPAAIHQLLRTR